MFCPNCNFNIVGNVNHCPNCGAPMYTPFFNVIPPKKRITDEEKKTLTFASVKHFFTSPLYVVLILITALNAIVSICAVAFGERGIEDIIEDSGFQNVGIASGRWFYYLVEGLPYVYILGIFVLLFVAVLRYVIYHSACKDNNETVSYKAINALRWSHWISFAFDSLYLALLSIAVLAPAARVNTTELEFRFLLVIFIVIIAVSYALPTLYTVFMTKSLKNIRNTAKSGIPNSKISVFVSVLLFIISGFSLSSLLNGISLVDIEWFSIASKLASIALNVILALVIIKYRALMKKLENL